MASDPTQLQTLPQQPAGPSSEVLALRKLIRVLQTGVELAAAAEGQSIYLVIVPPSGTPFVEICPDKDVLGARLTALRNEQFLRQRTDPEAITYTFIFYGHQWMLQKGPRWQIYDGQTLQPLMAQDVIPPFLDASGSMMDVLPPDQVLPPPAATPAPAPRRMPAVQQAQVSPTADAEIELPDFDEAGPDEEPQIEG